MLLIRGREQQQTQHPVGIIDVHRELAPDDFLFLVVFLGRQGGVHHRVRQNCERALDAIFRDIDPKNGAIERGVSIDVTADVLNFLRNVVRLLRLRSFEEHVLEDMRETGAELFIFDDAARRAPCLHARYRCAAIFLDDDGESVRQHEFLRAARRKREPVRLLSVLRRRARSWFRLRTIRCFQVHDAKRDCTNQRHPRRLAGHTVFGAGKCFGASTFFSGANGFTNASRKS